MDRLRELFAFIQYTAGNAGSKVIYGSSATGAATSKAVPEATDGFLSGILPYVPLLAVAVAALKLAFDIYKWRVEREPRK